MMESADYRKDIVEENEEYEEECEECDFGLDWMDDLDWRDAFDVDPDEWGEDDYDAYREANGFD